MTRQELQTTEAGALPDGALEWIEQVSGSAPARAEALASGAGRRRYWRLEFQNGDSRVLMWARNESPEILPPALRSQNACQAFVEITQMLSEARIPVPTLFGVDSERAWILIEDLGSRHLLDVRGEEQLQAQLSAIDLLARVHTVVAQPLALPFSRSFDGEWVRFELRLFLDRLKSRGPELEAALGDLAAAIEELPRCLCLRDYQSQNLMIDARGQLRPIDYQDALLAPRELDLAAFLFDSYLEIDAVRRELLLERYREVTGQAIAREALALLVVQRKCKDASRFQLLVSEQGDTRYRAAFDSACAAVRSALAELEASYPALARSLHAALGELTL